MATAACLALLALLHVYWAGGGRWPARDDTSLAELVAGAREMPSAIACHAVAVLLALAAAFVLGASDALTLPLPGWIALAGGWTVVGVLALRGLGGLVQGRLQPEIRRLRYHRWNLLLYSPLCLSLAALGAFEIS
ncbi:MAG: DUF3995 domain-containing protein [Actinobacteria bacterium]|nr:DUF3995 domain-containing protein [Actinomycetota bacterium]